jgi:hypothetical protein
LPKKNKFLISPFFILKNKKACNVEIDSNCFTFKLDSHCPEGCLSCYEGNLKCLECRLGYSFFEDGVKIQKKKIKN